MGVPKLDPESAREILGRTGELRMRVRGSSMGPWLRSGVWVTVTPLGSTPPRRGDVLLVNLGGRLVLHRAARRLPGGWITRGDASAADDPALTDDAVLGRLVGVHVRSLRFEHAPRWVELGFGRAILRAGAWPARVARALSQLRARR